MHMSSLRDCAQGEFAGLAKYSTSKKDLAELNKLNEKDMKTYELSEKRRYDYQLTVDYAEEKGLEKGLERGRIEGRHEGAKKGRHETTLFIARQMKDKGASLEFIVATTGLTSEQLKKI
ncbi:hypothetical protein AGMMS49525_03480 [Bacteroidia bacterium]|nr:hypothetical protein AGMMS49525_03480 [Bacteroidia bacterium]